jgi:hypothetical protein
VSAWNRNRYVRLGGAVFAAAVVVLAIAPATTAAGAVNQQNPSPPGAANRQRGVPDARHKTTPGHAKPSNSAPGPSQSQHAPAPGPRPVQRKDKPPDRDPHKYTPERRRPAAQQGRHRNNSQNDNRRQDDLPDTPASASGTAPSNASPQGLFQRGLLGWSNFLRKLTGERKPQTDEADSTRPQKRKTKTRNVRKLSGPHPVRKRPTPPRYTTECDGTRCLIKPSLPVWEKYMPEPRWNIRLPGITVLERTECTPTHCRLPRWLFDPPSTDNEDIWIPRTD